MSEHYVLDSQGDPVLEPDPIRWARWYGQSNASGDRERNLRNVAWTKIGDYTISTVFLALDHSFGHGAPVLWETMVFGPKPWDDWQDRYTSRADAEAGHARVCDLILHGQPPPD